MQQDSGIPNRYRRIQSPSGIFLDSGNWGRYDFRTNRPTGRLSADFRRKVGKSPTSKGFFPPLV